MRLHGDPSPSSSHFKMPIGQGAGGVQQRPSSSRGGPALSPHLSPLGWNGGWRDSEGTTSAHPLSQETPSDYSPWRKSQVYQGQGHASPGQLGTSPEALILGSLGLHNPWARQLGKFHKP